MPRSRTIALPLLLATTLVGSVAPASLAQDDVSTSAGVNADRVDGKHAVSATNKKKARADKLVATDTKGYLPSNILKPLWGLIQGLPAVLADGQVSWNELVGIPGDLTDGQVGWGEIANKPAGFADGVDDAGVTAKVRVQQFDSAPLNVAAGTSLVGFFLPCPAGSVIVGGGYSTVLKVALSRPDGPSDPGDPYGWEVTVERDPAEAREFTIRATCLSTAPLERWRPRTSRGSRSRSSARRSSGSATCGVGRPRVHARWVTPSPAPGTLAA